jgi:glutathione synthase/RimK-type ligase-like ATP-grasp enzyme
MIADVFAELSRRNTSSVLVAYDDLPGTARLGLSLGHRPDGFIRLADGRKLDFSAIRSVYQRSGFYSSEVWEDYSEEEARYANAECLAALTALLDTLPALVVNRPAYSGSNASKPYQIGLAEDHGFFVPRTMVTNHPEVAAEFYEACEGNVIYKSISYVRSIVKRMQPEDLERLDSLRNCPVQLQECVEGLDIRVHVVGQERLFASIIAAEESDYRYDKKAEIEAHELPDEVAAQCFSLARALGFVLTGIDLRVTEDGRYYCFEVNPSPAFSWYQARTGQPITEALCDVLEAPETAGFLP